MTMGLPRPNFLPVKQWLKTSFKHNESSVTGNSLKADNRNNEEDLSTVDDTVFLYDDTTGATSYNLSPVDEETVVSRSFDQHHKTQQLPQPPSLSVMLAQLERDVPPSSSIITEILISMSSNDVQRDRSTPMLFATAVRTHDEEADSVMHLLSNDDGDEEEDDDEERDDCERTNIFGEWMRKRSDGGKCRDFESMSPRLSGKDYSDPVRVYQAREDGKESDPVRVYQANVDNLDEISCDLKLKNSSYVQVQDTKTMTDDCTVSSVETAPVSNKTTISSEDRNNEVNKRIARRKGVSPRRSRWMVALRSKRYSSSLSAVMEDDE